MDTSALTRGLSSQLLAALRTLKDCIDRCPASEWNERHNDYPFCQVAFHALFDCDYHLCDSERELKAQAFHKDNVESFSDYEELLERKPRHLYGRGFIIEYYEHCANKAVSAIEAKNEASLLAPKADITKSMTRLERYINITRHAQHHAAQLGLRLQFLTGKEMDWIGRGYGE
jgi:hypothetical protein